MLKLFHYTRREVLCSFAMAENVQLQSFDTTRQLSKSAQRKIKKKQMEKQLRQQKKKKNVAESLKNNSDVIIDDHLKETTYYFENGLRKVYPYYFTFSTYAKGRWVKQRLLDVFTREFKYRDEEEIKKCMETGKITVNGKTIDMSYVVKNNDYVQNTVHRHELPVTKDGITVLENTDQLLVVNKPSSIPIHPCGRYRHNTLLYILAKEYGFKNLRPINRLDRLTSGVVVFCKSEGRAHQMITDIKNRLVEKEYVCRVEGEFPSGVVECKEPIDVMCPKMGLHKVGPNGKEAHTSFERISYNGSESVVKCKPHTGRTHQIRVHLQYIGYPITNDSLYTGNVWGPQRGKGGVFGKPEEEIIKDIFDHHNSEQYILGTSQNSCVPETQDSNVCTVTTDVSSDLNTTNKIITERSATITDIINVRQNKGTDNTDVKISVKRPHVTEDDGSIIKDSKVIKLDINEKGDSSDDPKEIVKLESKAEKSLNSVDSLLKDTELSNYESVSKEDVLVDNNPISYGSANFPLCDKSLIVYDKDCESCKKGFKDPLHKDLTMYLHAYNYKGPDWEFRAPLPAWAHEDWTEENSST